MRTGWYHIGGRVSEGLDTNADIRNISSVVEQRAQGAKGATYSAQSCAEGESCVEEIKVEGTAGSAHSELPKVRYGCEGSTRPCHATSACKKGSGTMTVLYLNAEDVLVADVPPGTTVRVLPRIPRKAVFALVKGNQTDAPEAKS